MPASATDQQLATGEIFNFLIPLAKVSKADGKVFIEGVASDTGLDMQGQSINAEGQDDMAQWAKSGTVTLGGEADHFKLAFNDDMGEVVDGSVSDAGEFFIKAQLDMGMSKAKDLIHALEVKKKKLGLSVFGTVTKYGKNEDGVPVISGVDLTRVMVTPNPANPRTWLANMAKSLPAPVVALETASPEEAPDNAEATVKLDQIAGGGIDVAKDVPETPDPRALAKGMFLDAMRQKSENEAELASLQAEMDRIYEIDSLFWVLWDVMYAIDWAQYDGAITADVAAELLREAIGEFKTEVMAKAQLQAETADTIAKAEAADVTQNVGQTEEPSTIKQEGTTMTAKTMNDVAKELIADDGPVGVQSAHPAAKAGQEFAAAVTSIVTNPNLSDEQRQQAMVLAMGGTAAKIDKALTVDAPVENVPAWAQILVKQVSTLHDVVAQRIVNVNADSVAKGTSPDNVDKTTDVVLVPGRKSQPVIAASTIVQRPDTMGDVAKKLLGIVGVGVLP